MRRSRLKIFSLYFAPQFSVYTKFGIDPKYEMGKPVVFYIECKRYGRQNSVGVNIVRSLYGVQSADQINKAILVTTGHVTRGARRFVDDQNTMMSVIDVEEIHELIQRSARKYRGY